jgi:hypothetical protein
MNPVIFSSGIRHRRLSDGPNGMAMVSIALPGACRGGSRHSELLISNSRRFAARWRDRRQNQALEQTRDSVLRYGEVVGCELLNFFVLP